MVKDVLTPTFVRRPYWWDAAPPSNETSAGMRVPATAECVIVGAGYTGLSAALTLARAGRHVIVLEAEAPGFGASTRNHGYVGSAPFGGWQATLKSFGLERAIAIYREYERAFKYTQLLIAREQIECHFEQRGRAYFAYTQRQLDAKAAELDALREHLGREGYVLGSDRIREELGSDQYLGAVVHAGTGACHPALYHAGLLRAAQRAGALVIAGTRVLRLEAARGGFAAQTAAGSVTAKHVLLATNGYTGRESGVLRRRVIPVHAHLIATESVSPALARRLFPSGRTLLDLRGCFHSWRLSPVDNRVLFLGRTGMLPPSDPRRFCRALHDEMTEIYPELAGVLISHYWHGQMGFSFDFMPHVGEQHGIHYALALCGTGLIMGTHLGNQAAARILDSTEGTTAFDSLPFPSKRWHTGRPWFVPPYAAAAYWMGRAERRSAS